MNIIVPEINKFSSCKGAVMKRMFLIEQKNLYFVN